MLFSFGFLFIFTCFLFHLFCTISTHFTLQFLLLLICLTMWQCRAKSIHSTYARIAWSQPPLIETLSFAPLPHWFCWFICLLPCLAYHGVLGDIYDIANNVLWFIRRNIQYIYFYFLWYSLNSRSLLAELTECMFSQIFLFLFIFI